MTEELQPPLDLPSKIAYYKEMEQRGENLIHHARKHLGWLAVGMEPPQEGGEDA